VDHPNLLGGHDMKHILFLALVGTIVSGCVKSPAPNQETSKLVNSENGKDIRKWMGAVSFRMAKDGVREIVLRAKNNTKNNLWVPASSGGVRGMSGAEAVNLTEMDPKSMKSLHVDFSRCKFPDQYEMVKPGQSWEYIHKLPNDFRGDIKISVWAPWRTDQGIFVTKETKMAALKNGDLLIEEVEGIGHFEEEDLLQDKSSVRDNQPADLQR
jgi:hypothetical protein